MGCTQGQGVGTGAAQDGLYAAHGQCVGAISKGQLVVAGTQVVHMTAYRSGQHDGVGSRAAGQRLDGAVQGQGIRPQSRQGQPVCASAQVVGVAGDGTVQSQRVGAGVAQHAFDVAAQGEAVGCIGQDQGVVSTAQIECTGAHATIEGHRIRT